MKAHANWSLFILNAKFVLNLLVVMAVKHVLRGSMFLLLIYTILKDLSDPCFGLQSSSDYTSTNFAIGQEVNAFSPPKFSLRKSLFETNAILVSPAMLRSCLLIFQDMCFSSLFCYNAMMSHQTLVHQ